MQEEKGLFRPPSEKELAQVEELFVRTLQGRDLPSLKADWAKMGMVCNEISFSNKKGILIHEMKDEQSGRGIYLFIEGSSRVFLQAPHSFFDKDTGKIVAQLMAEGEFAGACWNSVPRYAIGHYKGPADTQAHRANYFVSFARAFSRLRPHSYIVQIHGFGAKKRKSEIGRAAGAIVSSGAENPSFPLRTLVASLKVRLPEPVRLYPFEVRELGATKNVCGQTLRQFGHSGFVHIEFNGNLRKRLLTEKALRAKLARGLLGHLN